MLFQRLLHNNFERCRAEPAGKRQLQVGIQGGEFWFGVLLLLLSVRDSDSVTPHRQISRQRLRGRLVIVIHVQVIIGIDDDR